MLTSENCAGRRELDTFSHEKKRPYGRYQCFPFDEFLHLANKTSGGANDTK
jgi:hypothetical protein